MHDTSESAGASAPAPGSATSRRPLGLAGGWPTAPTSNELERSTLIEQARQTDAGRQLQRCFPRWARLFEQLTWRALTRLARNEPVDPNEPDVWHSRDEHAQVVLRRHGMTRVSARRLHLSAVRALIDGQARADREAGLDWTRDHRTRPRARRRAEPRPRPAADRPRRPARVGLARRPASRARAQARRRRRAGGRPVALDARAPGRVRGRRPALLAHRLPHVAGARRPAARSRRAGSSGRSACSPCPPCGPPTAGSWCPCIALDAIRLIAALGGTRGPRPARRRAARRRDRRAARTDQRSLPARRAEGVPGLGVAARERAVARAGNDRQPGRAARQARPLGPAARDPAQPHAARTGRGAQSSSCASSRSRRASSRDAGSARPHATSITRQPSAVMDLGEAVQTAVERGLPLLLSTEAAGHLKDTVRVGRMKGRPGVLTITSADGLSASTRRVVAEQAIAELRALKRQQAHASRWTPAPARPCA